MAGKRGATDNLDTQLEAVGHTVRRELLYELLRTVREGRSAVRVDSFYDADGDTREVTLRHGHLPKLAEYGFINVEAEGECVSPGPQFDDLRPLLAHLASSEGADTDQGAVNGRE